jgi:predicted nucleotidyltransferase
LRFLGFAGEIEVYLCRFATGWGGIEMKITGVIVEFNPLHGGHLEHLTLTRAGCDCIVAAMSGNFVQRGEPAVYDKWARTRAALEGGVDIVLEIPVAYACAAADYFARGAVGLLAATGVVDALSFGSECGDLTAITAGANLLATEPPIYKKELRQNLKLGMSFAAAKGRAMATCLNDSTPSGLLDAPNNGLAMEYVKANIKLGNPLKMQTTYRAPGGPSATKLRRELRTTTAVPSLDGYTAIFKYALATSICNNEITNRFRAALSHGQSLSAILAAAKTKHHTLTRLQRHAMRLILRISPETMELFDKAGGVQYIRVLGFRRKAAGLLGEMTRKATLPVITSGAALDKILQSSGAAARMLTLDLHAGDIYAGTAGHSERGTGIVVV